MNLHSCNYYCSRPECIKAQRDEFVKRMEDADDELYCWKVHNTTDEFTGYCAEEEAKAVAKRIGGTSFAFPLYVKPQPPREWVGLTDVEIGDALIDLPVLGNGYFLRISRAIEKALKEKNT